ncbi:baeRF7 domain-containing protein [Candidatus Nitrospira allomarina]|uniref:Uncharacterized protein n=1 Tax=Candidatus Nitrospira allomarina TaxID=3020900 RepID=A0AA96JXD8_9BACT|nr:hypothetical protein [Candidatus Nitrospira allomarina]WNM56609.1 hypothetical protein PP769_11530 [Candidatus Nitrospira allomarina]
MSITIQDLQDLLEQRESPCVSLFMPTHPAGPETRQDPIRLNNLLKETEQQLTEQGIRSADARTWLDPLSELLEDEQFWQHQDQGLAMYVAKDWHRIFRLPLILSELTMVESRFYLKPILPVFMYGGTFYLLALSQNHIRFFQGSQDGLQELHIPDIPRSMKEANLAGTGEQSLQWHTKAPNAGGQRAAMFHGQGGGDDEAKSRISQFFQQVAKGLHQFLHDVQAPLYLTGVEYLIPIYKDVNTYPHTKEEGVTGNADEKSLHELHRQVWPVVKADADHGIEEAKIRCEEFLGTSKASHDLETVVFAAHEGKIDTLFVARNIQQWGRIDVMQNRVETEPTKSAESLEILDVAVVQTLLKKGTVYALPQEKMPGRTSLAAMFRY